MGQRLQIMLGRKHSNLLDVVHLEGCSVIVLRQPILRTPPA